MDDCRHDPVVGGDAVTHLATATSIKDLREQVAKLCPGEPPFLLSNGFACSSGQEQLIVALPSGKLAGCVSSS